MTAHVTENANLKLSSEDKKIKAQTDLSIRLSHLGVGSRSLFTLEEVAVIFATTVAEIEASVTIDYLQTGGGETLYVQRRWLVDQIIQGNYEFQWQYDANPID